MYLALVANFGVFLFGWALWVCLVFFPLLLVWIFFNCCAVSFDFVVVLFSSYGFKNIAEICLWPKLTFCMQIYLTNSLPQAGKYTVLYIDFAFVFLFLES